MDLENLKRKTIEEMQKQSQKQAELQKQIEVLENVAKQYMTREAIQRYYTLKSAHPEKAVRAIAIITSLVQSNQLQDKISDEDFKDLLQKIDQKKEFNIRR